MQYRIGQGFKGDKKSKYLPQKSEFESKLFFLGPTVHGNCYRLDLDIEEAKHREGAWILSMGARRALKPYSFDRNSVQIRSTAGSHLVPCCFEPRDWQQSIRYERCSSLHEASLDI